MSETGEAMPDQAGLVTKERAFSAAALASPEVIANPYPFYDQLRAGSPVYGYRDLPPGTVPGQDEPKTCWAVLRYADVSEAARDPATFSSADPLQADSSAPTLMLVNEDPPRHGELRAIAHKAFTPRRILDKAPWVAAAAAEVVSSCADRDIDFMAEIAPVLPARVMAQVIGVDDIHAPLFRNWATAFMLSADLTPAQREASNAEAAAFFIDHVTRRYALIGSGAEAPDDLVTALIREEADGGRLTPDEVIRFCLTLVVAGAETTTFLLGNLVATLLDHPELYAALRADRALIKPFIQETLRCSGPPQRLFRIASVDTELGGARIRAGDWVALFFGAANHDPEVFEDPHAFRMNRPNANQQLTFGHGIHHCLGAGLARMEAEALLNAMLDRFVAVEPGQGPRVRQTASLLNYGLDHCPVRLVSG
jgi:cytochrome P450